MEARVRLLQPAARPATSRPRRAAWRSGSSRCSRRTAAGRSTAGGPGHLVDHHRGVLRAEARRPRRRRAGARAARATSSSAHGGLATAGVFTRIWLAYFGQFPLAGVPAHAGRAGAAAAVVPAQHLRDVELGARDRRAAPAAHGASAARCASPTAARRRALAASADATPTSRFARSRELVIVDGTSSSALDRALEGVGAEPVEAAPPPRDRARHRVDPPPPGLERAVGRHPAADAELRAGAARDRLRARSSRDRERHPGRRRLPRRVRGHAHVPAVRLAELGHGARREGAARRRRRPRRIRCSAAPPTGWSRTRSSGPATGRSTTRASSRAAGRSSSRTTGTPTSTTRPSS